MSLILDGSTGMTTNAGGLVNPSTTIDGINYSCRAWVNFNGTGTVAIRGSGNVTSITDNGTGDYTLNFTTAMSDANYCTVGTCNFDAAGTNSRFLSAPYTTAPTVSAIRVATQLSSTLALNDCAFVFVSIFR